MKLPKQNEQKYFMGNLCVFSGEYVKEYKRKKIGTEPIFAFRAKESTPVKWEISHRKLTGGWITGFGYVYNGTIVSDAEDGNYFAASKRINFVRVRVTPSGKEYKVPLSKIAISKKV